MRGARMIGAALLLPALLSQAGGPPAATLAAGAAHTPTSEHGVAAPALGGAGLSVTPTARTTTGSTKTPPGQGKGDKGGGTVTPIDPAPLDPLPLDPLAPGATEPDVTEPAPTEPAPTEPAPTEPVPTEPAPPGPAATEPAGTEPADADPGTIDPVEVTPAATEPAFPAPISLTPVPAPDTSTAPVAPDASDGAHRVVPFGVTVPWGPLDGEALATTSATVGTTPSYLQWYTGWYEAPDVAKLQAVVDAGAVPVVTWEPWVWTDGVDQPRFAMSTVAAGHHDGYLTAWADALAAWGGPVLLRFAHEANGTWYPWSVGVNGNTAADHVAAWRHVHDLFDRRGADMVRWVWAPNVVYPGSTALTSLYPGDEYVDVVGVDGYNWGTSVPWEQWRTPAEVFDPTLAELRALAPGKPLLIAETASSELGGDKAAWVSQLFAWAAEQPDLVGIIWFDENKETDWRIASSPEAAAAFRAAFTPEAT